MNQINDTIPELKKLISYICVNFNSLANKESINNRDMIDEYSSNYDKKSLYMKDVNTLKAIRSNCTELADLINQILNFKITYK